MANRSYLYTTDLLPPEDGPRPEKMPLLGIAEWNYDIPYAFMLLMSSNPVPRRSSIWSLELPIAIFSDYAGGVATLVRFLERVDVPGGSELVREAIDFLSRPENQRKYLVLEAGEIFQLEDTPMEAEAASLLELLGTVESEADSVLAAVSARQRHPGSWLSRKETQTSSEPVDPLVSVKQLGLGEWSNHLYHSFDA